MMKTKEGFIEALAEYLVGNEVEMGIGLQMGRPEAKAWQKLRDATPLFGYYPDRSRAVKELAEFLR